MRKSSLDPLLRISALLLLTSAFCNAGEETEYLEKYCSKKAFGEYELSSDKKTCTATFPISSSHLEKEQAMEECSKMSPMAVVDAVTGELTTQCKYKQLGKCSPSFGTTVIMVSSTCLAIQHDQEAVTYDEAVKKCEKLGASVLLSNRHYFRFITEHVTTKSLPFQSYWYGRSSTTKSGKVMARIVYTGIRSLTLIRPGFTERVPTTEKHHVVCMKSAARIDEDVKEDAAMTAAIFYGATQMNDRIYLLSRGLHQAKFDGTQLTFENFDRACKGVVGGLASVAAIPVQENKDDMMRIIRDLPPISVPGRRNPSITTEPPSSFCKGDSGYRQKGQTYFQFVRKEHGAEETGTVEAGWKPDFPDNKCADGDNTQLVMDEKGLMDAPFFVRNRVLCQLGKTVTLGKQVKGSHCGPNSDYIESKNLCKCKIGYRNAPHAKFPGQYCEPCSEHLVPIHLNILFDNTRWSYDKIRSGPQRDAMKALIPVFGKQNITGWIMTYGDWKHKYFSSGSPKAFDSEVVRYCEDHLHTEPYLKNWIDMAIDNTTQRCSEKKGKRCITVLVTTSISFDMDCESSCNTNRLSRGALANFIRTEADKLRTTGSKLFLIEADSGTKGANYYNSFTAGERIYKLGDIPALNTIVDTEFCDYVNEPN